MPCECNILFLLLHVLIVLIRVYVCVCVFMCVFMCVNVRVNVCVCLYETWQSNIFHVIIRDLAKMKIQDQNIQLLLQAKHFVQESLTYLQRVLDTCMVSSLSLSLFAKRHTNIHTNKHSYTYIYSR